MSNNFSINQESFLNSDFSLDERNDKSNIFIVPFKNELFSDLAVFFICLLLYLIILFLYTPSNIVKIIETLIGIIIVVLSVLFLEEKQLKFIKLKSKNLLEIRIINYLCFTKKKFDIILDNANFECRKYNYKVKTKEFENLKLFLINNFQNPKDIDLDSSNIKNVPIQFYYIFHEVINNNNDFLGLKKNLNDFVNPQDKYENPLFHYYDINKKGSIDGMINCSLSKFMKISDRFFVYHFDSPNTKKSELFIYMFFFNYSIIGLLVYFFQYFIKEIYIALIILSILLIVFNSIIFLIIKIRNKKIFRIDFIYSSNLDKIFIGLVKKNMKSYDSTFIFQLNQIKKFIFKQKENTLDTFTIQMELLNNNIINIYESNSLFTDNEIVDLIKCLNEKLNNNTNINNNQQYEYTSI